MTVHLAPHAPDWDWAGWTDTAELVTVHPRFDAAWEAAGVREAEERGVALLSVRTTPHEVQIGPLRRTADDPCAGCADVREQWRWTEARQGAGTPAPTVPSGPAYPPLLGPLAAASCSGPPLRPGEMMVLAANGTVRRHRVRRSARCRVCAPTAPDTGVDSPPSPLALSPRPAPAERPTRGSVAPFDLDLGRMRAALGDPRFGPATKVVRDVLMPFAVTEISIVGGTPPGYGRATTFGDAERIGYFEALERLGGHPYALPGVRGRSARELGALALDLGSLGHYTDEQYASPRCRLRPVDDDTAMDWVWARPLSPAGGEPVLVPADVAYYQYQYADDPAFGPQRRNYFLESSSGCALGGSPEEAMLHSLFELVERDAFLLAWHRGRPLRRIEVASVADRESALLAHQISSAGFDLHLLAISADIPIPVVWALAVNRRTGLPASFSAAGSGPDPVVAVRSALWEVTQMVTAGLNWDPVGSLPSVADPWQVDLLNDHPHRYAHPELLPRVLQVLGGPVGSLADAFPGWPDVFNVAAGGDVSTALRHVADLYAAAGLDRILVVDQSSPEHDALGVSVVKCVVPGILPMCFGQAQQRLAGLPRLDVPFPDPHPFP